MQNNEILKCIQNAFELREEKCYKQAIEVLYKILETESDNEEVLFQIGELYYLMKNNQRAIQYSEKVLAKNPNHADSMVLLRKIYTDLKMYDEAEHYAEKLLEIIKNSRNIAEFIKLAGKNGHFDKIETYKNSYFTDENVRYAICHVYYEQGKITEAKELLQSITGNEEALILLAKIYFEENNIVSAKELLSKLPKNYDNAEVLNYRGLFYLEDMNFTEAIKSFSKALNINKQNACYAYNLGNAYFYNGWIKEAVQAYKNAICLAPDILDYRYSLSYLYYETQSFEKAQKEIDFILINNPKHTNAIILNALLKLHNKDFLGAKDDLEKILKTTENEFAGYSLVNVYNELNMYDDAEKILQYLINKSSENYLYRCEYAKVLTAKSKNTDALDILRRIIEENENYLPAYALASEAAYNERDWDTAKDYAQRSLAIDMNFAPGYYYLALVRIEEKDYDEAIECMKRAVMYDLNNPKYYSAMSNIFKLKGDIKSALDYAAEAAAIDNSTEYKLLYSNLAAQNRKNKTLPEKTCPLKK